MYFDRDAEHPALGFAVEVLTIAERIQGDGFSGESGDDTRLDCRKVRDNTPIAGTRDESVRINYERVSGTES